MVSSNFKTVMKKTITFLLLLFFNFVFCQSPDDALKKSLEKLSKEYLTKMYIDKDYEAGSKMWDDGMLLEMQDYYRKSSQGNFSDAVLVNKVKVDIEKYYKKLTKFKVEKILDIQLEAGEEFSLGYVSFEYLEMIKNKSKTNKTTLIFITKDYGKTWAIQDWKIKDIADKINRKIF